MNILLIGSVFVALAAMYFLRSRALLLLDSCDLRSKARRVQVELLSMNFTVLAFL